MALTRAHPIETPWAERTRERVPLSEYPRPALVRPDWLCLNGAWEYAVVDSVGALGQANWPGPDGTIVVPFAIETAASGVARDLRPDQTLLYRRTIDVPPAWRGRRVALRFEAVDYEAAVLVDGRHLITHVGGYLPFAAEFTAGERHEVVVAVRDPSDAGGQQRGKQALRPRAYLYTATSGIWQTVWLEPLPDNAITRVLATTPATRDAIDVVVATDAPTPVTVAVDLGEGAKAEASGQSGTAIRIPIPRPRLWSPADPHLYPVTVRTADDEVATYAALRTVGLGKLPGRERERQAVVLNGEPILINLPLDQGYWPESGMTPPADDALAFDLDQARALGFNGLRKHVKIESRRYYYHADRLGMLIMQDAPSGGTVPLGTLAASALTVFDEHAGDTSHREHESTGRRSAVDRREFVEDLVGMIDLLAPHPSIIAWVPFNEGWGQFDSARIADVVRRRDPSRLVDPASGWFDVGVGHFRSRHRYVLPLLPPPLRDRRPLLISEFGGYNLALPGHLWDDDARFGYRFYRDAAALERALSRLWRRQLIPLVRRGLRGCVYTQLSDVEIESNGLLTYDRRVCKVSAEAMRRLNDELAAAFDALWRDR